jgi:GNAT superfamily N-acetyltransferase
MFSMEAAITHVFGDITTRETFGNYPVSIVRDTREQHMICQTGECPALLENFRIMAADSFGVEIQAKRSEGIRSHVYNMDLMVIIHDSREIYAFASADIRKDLGLCYLNGIAVKQSFQAQGVGKRLIECLLRQQPYDRIAFTTQNPVVCTICCKRCFEKYIRLRINAPYQ